MTETLRLFVAIELPPALQRRVAALQAVLRTELDAQPGTASGRARWVQPSDLHLTLRFLGAFPAGSLGALERALDRAAAAVAPCDLELEGLGSFGGRVLWLGVGGDTACLHALHKALEAALEPLAGRDPRAFKPHLTLARLSQETSLVPPGTRWPAVPLRAAQLTLVRSDPSGKPRYTALYRAPFGEQAG